MDFIILKEQLMDLTFKFLHLQLEEKFIIVERHFIQLYYKFCILIQNVYFAIMNFDGHEICTIGHCSNYQKLEKFVLKENSYLISWLDIVYIQYGYALIVHSKIVQRILKVIK